MWGGPKRERIASCRVPGSQRECETQQEQRWLAHEMFTCLVLNACHLHGSKMPMQPSDLRQYVTWIIHQQREPATEQVVMPSQLKGVPRACSCPKITSELIYQSCATGQSTTYPNSCPHQPNCMNDTKYPILPYLLVVSTH